MTSLTHMVFGGAMTTKIRKPWAAAAAAFFSHFLLDAVPHNDYLYFYLNDWEYVYFSPMSLVLLGLGIGLLLLIGWRKKNKFNFWLAGGLAALPDVITGSTQVLRFTPTFFDRFHHWAHTHFDLGEYLYKVMDGGVLEAKTNFENALINFERINGSLGGSLGWGLEIVGEILLIFAAILVIRNAQNHRPES